MLFMQYAERLKRRQRAQSTIANFTMAAVLYSQFLTERQLTPETATAEDAEFFFATIPYALTTKKVILSNIRAAYRYGMARGLISTDPTYDVLIPAQNRPAPRVLSIEELRTMKELCYSERQWLLFHLFAYTGCRRKEVRDLYWHDVSLENNTIRVWGKGGKERFVPIHPALGEVLAGAKPEKDRAIINNPWGEPVDFKTLWLCLDSISSKATFHDFRRTVASSLDANGVPESEISEIMGWSPATIFGKHYRHIAPARLQTAILKLYANDPL